MSRIARVSKFDPAVWRHCLVVLAWLALAIVFVSPVTQVLTPDLDSSIHATYAYFTAHGFQYGTEVNTTAGPYGFVAYGWDYAGELFWVRLLLMILCALATSALTLWCFIAAGRGPVRWLWMVAVLFGVTIGDNLFVLPLFLGGLFLLLNYERPDRLTASVAVSVFLALLALMKGTQLALALGVLCCVAILAARLRSWRRAFWIVGAFLVALLGWWIAAGQNPLNFPAYVDGIRQISQGYNEAMALEEPPHVFAIGVVMLLLLVASLGWTAWLLRRQSVMLPVSALFAGFAAVSWKHGYVRADGHVFIFLDFAWVLAASFPLCVRATGAPRLQATARAITIGLVCAAAAVSLGGGEQLTRGRLHWLITGFADRWLANAHYVFKASRVKTQRDAELMAQARAQDLPTVRSVVQQRSIDMFGHEMGRLLLNDLNYQPAPMCCATYHVYNRHFKQLNRRHFADPATRPDFVLLKTQSIDDRLIAQDDSLSLLALLDLFRPVLVENGNLLLESRGAAAGLQFPKPIASRKIKFNEEIVVPTVGEDELLLFSLSIPASWRGRWRSFLYKPPAVFIDLHGDGLKQPYNQRVLVGSLAVPCLLSPVLEETPDFLALFTREKTKRIQRFRLHTSLPACFDEDSLEVRFFTVGRPAPVSPNELRTVFPPDVYHDSPDEVQPADASINYYQGRRVQHLPAPASIRYQLVGDERVISMTIGVLDEAYLEGRTDGVMFKVELQQPGQPPEVLNHRHLHPTTEPRDRGPQDFSAFLPPKFALGSYLTLRCDPGPSGDSAWDWAFATSIKITRGDFRPEQFPGFQVLPSSTEGTSITRMGVGAEAVLMMGPPSAVIFDLHEGEQQLNFTAGMLEGSYTSGETDGVTFHVELLHDDGRVQSVFNRWLQPKSIPADRGPQSFTVPLPPFEPGTRLRLRNDEGPHGNGSWDWAYVSQLSLK